MKKLLFFIIFLVLSSNAIAYSCITYKDCPKIECGGAVRQCIDNICQTSECIVPDSSSIEPREDVESFEDAVKPYEKGINLSIRTKNPNLIQNNLLGSLGIQGVLILMFKGIGIFIIALFASLFFIYAKAKGILKMVLLIILPIFIVMSAIFFIGGSEGINKIFSGDKSWKTISIDEFLESDTKEVNLEPNQIKYLSARLLDASEFVLDKDNEELSVMIFEMDDVTFLRSLRIGSLRGDNVRVSGEYIIKQNLVGFERYVFDEDRFVFIITGSKNNIQYIAEQIIGNYPGIPSQSRLFITDLIPPEIYDINPSKGFLTNIEMLSFKISDNESGVDISSLRLFNIDGFSTEYCIFDANVFQCSFTPDNLKEGTVNFEIAVSDMEGNTRKTLSNFIFDNTPVSLDIMVPEEDSYTNSDWIYFRLVDKASGIDSVKIDGAEIEEDNCNRSKNALECALSIDLMSGENIILIETLDEAGNYDILQNTLFYDDDPPEITIKDYSFIIKDISGVSMIRVNDKAYSISGCSIEEFAYYCSSSVRVESVYVKDKAGNDEKEY